MSLFNSISEKFFPADRDEIRDLLNVVGEVLFDFGLYSDKPSFAGRYVFPLKLAGSPMVVGGWLKIPINTALLPKAVFKEDLIDERLLAALKKATGRNVETRVSDRLILPSLFTEKPRKQRDFASFDLWYVVELSSKSLRGIPRFIPFSDIPGPDDGHFISWPFGLTMGGQWFMADFPTEIISLFVSGATRQGKSAYLRSCMHYLASYYQDEFRVIAADFKRAQTDFKMFAGDNRFKLFNDPVSLIEFVDSIDRERSRVLNDSDCLNIFEFNSRSDTSFLPYTFVIIDEFAALRLSLAANFPKKESDILLNRIMVLTATTAATGCYWIIGTQRPGVDVVPGTMKTNINAMVCFSMPSVTHAQVVFDDEKMAEFPVSLGCPGRAFASISDSFFEFQSGFYK